MTRLFMNSVKYNTIFPNVAKIIKYYFKYLNCKIKICLIRILTKESMTESNLQQITFY